MTQTMDHHRCPELYPVLFRTADDGRAQALAGYAMRLWSGGHEVAAAVMARAAIEKHVTTLCSNDVRVPRRRRRCICDRMRALVAAGVFDEATGQHFDQVMTWAHAAAHGSPVRFDRLAEVVRVAVVLLQVEPRRTAA